MTIAQYLDKLNTRFKTGISREHSYRGDLQTLLETTMVKRQKWKIQLFIFTKPF